MAATCPVVRKLLLEYEAGTGMDNPTGLWRTCEGLICFYCCVMCYQTLLRGPSGYVISLQQCCALICLNRERVNTL